MGVKEKQLYFYRKNFFVELCLFTLIFLYFVKTIVKFDYFYILPYKSLVNRQRSLFLTKLETFNDLDIISYPNQWYISNNKKIIKL